jgi:hypothetical protein
LGIRRDRRHMVYSGNGLLHLPSNLISAIRSLAGHAKSSGFWIRVEAILADSRVPVFDSSVDHAGIGVDPNAPVTHDPFHGQLEAIAMTRALGNRDATAALLSARFAKRVQACN